MTDINQLEKTDIQQINDFKREFNIQATQAQISKFEYNLVDATIDKGTLRRACQDANSLKLGAVCVLPCFVKSCVNFLGSDPQTSLIACISYPHGGDTTEIKVAAVKRAVKEGVDEVEVTAPLAFVKDGSWAYVKREFKKLKGAVKRCGLRINIESDLLTPAEIAKICTVASDCGITSLCVSSGVKRAGINGETISRMRSAVKDKCTIKTSGVSSLTEMNTAVSMGAGILGSKNAADLARLILKTIE